MDLESKVDQLTAETLALKKEITQLKVTINNQNKIVTDMLEEQHALLKGMLKSKYSTRFPLLNQGDLDALESEIDDENRDDMVASVKRLLASGGIMKHTVNVLAKEIVLDYNVDGIHGKKRLLDYPNLMDILFKGSDQNGYEYKHFLDDLRKGLKVVKNRHFKMVCMQKKKDKDKEKEKERVANEMALPKVEEIWMT